MFSLKINPHNPNKIMEDSHKKYMSAVELLKQYNKHKSDLQDVDSVSISMEEIVNYIKKYRQNLKVNELEYQMSYTPKKRSWSNSIKQVNHSFIVPVDLHKQKIKYLKNSRSELLDKFRHNKIQLREPKLETRVKMINSVNRKITYKKCGGVIHKIINSTLVPNMGVYMKFLKNGDRRIVSESKIPKAKDNYIGIELEFFCPLSSESLIDLLHDSGLGEYVCLQKDGSIKTEVGNHAHELTILAKEKNINDVIKQICLTLKVANARINNSCGMHVHLDMRNRDYKTAFHNLVSSQNVLFAMNPFSRQTGTYCRKVETKDFDKAASIGRYFGINAQAYNKHKTIEIRMHSGTVVENKINNWVSLLTKIISKKEKVESSATSLKHFIKMFDIDNDLIKYIFERIAKFSGEDKKQEEEKGVA